VAEAVAEALAGSDPDLAGRVVVGPASVDDPAQYPSVVVLPCGRDRLQPTQDGDALALADGTPPGVAVVTSGEWRGVWQLRVLATTPEQREAFEDAVLAAFPASYLDVAMRPAVRGVQVVEDVLCTLTLATIEWVDGQAQDGRHYSYLEVEVQYPRLRVLQEVQEAGEFVLTGDGGRDLEIDTDEAGDLIVAPI
jgi:hypothetical protein